MIELSITADTPGAKWCKIWEIEKELYIYEKEIFPLYKEKLTFKFYVCFRCLPKSFNRKSIRRYYKEENILGVDIAIEEELMRPFIEGKFYPLSKEKQRLIMGEYFYSFLAQTFKNYKGKVPGIKEYSECFLKDTRHWLVENKWLSEMER